MNEWLGLSGQGACNAHALAYALPEVAMVVPFRSAGKGGVVLQG